MNNILITGATGFVGHAVMDYYENNYKMQDKIFIISSHVVKGYNTIIHEDNIFEAKELPDKIDYLLCIAGYVPKTTEQRDNRYCHAIAVSGLKYLLDNLPSIPKRIVFCSSVDVYGRNNGDKIINENDKSYAYDFYSAQKLMCEGLIEEYSRRNNVDYSILRLGPMFGGHDLRREFFMPGIIYKALANEEITLKVNPSVKRNYIYVKDSAKAIWNALLTSEVIPNIINVVSHNNITMDEMISAVIKITDSHSNYIIEPNGSLVTGQMIFDNSLMEEYLGIEEYSFESAIKETLQFIR